MLHALCAALVFLIADGFYQYWRGVDIFGQPTHLYGELFFRLTGPFYAQHLGLLMVWTVLPAACYMLATPRKHSLAALGGILLMALTVTLVFATGERMAFIFIVFACALFILFSRALRMRMLLVAALIATAIAGFSMVDHRLITRQVEGTSSDVENLSSSSYGQVWSSAANIALEHPLFGVGAKNFQPTCIKMHGFTEQNLQTDVPCPLHSHNFYLEWLVEHGAIGLSLWLLVCYHWLQLAWKNRQFIAGDAVASALMATLIIRFWPIAATSSQFTAWSAAPLWLAVGWLVALLNAQNAKQS
jgi:O-antigen ligase